MGARFVAKLINPSFWGKAAYNAAVTMGRNGRNTPTWIEGGEGIYSGTQVFVACTDAINQKRYFQNWNVTPSKGTRLTANRNDRFPRVVVVAVGNNSRFGDTLFRIIREITSITRCEPVNNVKWCFEGMRNLQRQFVTLIVFIVGHIMKCAIWIDHNYCLFILYARRYRNVVI